MRTLEALCRRLVPLYAVALDLPADFFDACFAEPHMILRMSRYPIIDVEDEMIASLVSESQRRRGRRRYRASAVVSGHAVHDRRR